jgi:hypothetical protein
MKVLCPNCGADMVKVTRQNEEGDWSRGWECSNCQPTEEEVKEIEAEYERIIKKGKKDV